MNRSLITCIILFILVPISVSADKKPFGNGLYWDLSTDGVLTISGNGLMPDDERPWRYKGAIKKVVIQYGVTAIGANSFSEVAADNNLASAVIASSVTIINENAFADCIKLRTIDVGKSITTIGDGAFFRCESLSSITLPSTVITIHDDAFLATGLTSVIIPNSVKSIGEAAFAECPKLSSISIPNSVKSIGEDAFKGEDDDECFKGTIVSMPQWLLDKGKEGWTYCGLSESSVNEFKRNNTPDKVIKRNGGYTSVVEMKNGNTKYYKVSKGGRYGLTDSEGKEIVPCEMEALESAGTGYLKYKINGFWGLMNYTGKILIDTDRGYTSIGDFKTFNKRFPYTMNGYKGECDATGRQISKIKMETPRQSTSVASSSSSSSSSSSTSSSSSNNNSGNNTTTVVVEHKHDPVPMQVWKQCTGCYGSGMCQSGCGGSGWFTGYSGNSTRCIGCGGSGKCQFCAGQGGHYEVEYR